MVVMQGKNICANSRLSMNTRKPRPRHTMTGQMMPQRWTAKTFRTMGYAPMSCRVGILTLSNWGLVGIDACCPQFFSFGIRVWTVVLLW